MSQANEAPLPMAAPSYAPAADAASCRANNFVGLPLHRRPIQNVGGAYQPWTVQLGFRIRFQNQAQRFKCGSHSHVAESAAMPLVTGASADSAERPITDARELFRWMVVARALGTTLCALNVRWFPIEGEEAVHVGSFVDLRPDDVAAPHYRDPFVVYLMRGAELWRLVAQVLGKSAGYNKGRSVAFNGPFHLGVVPWVAGDLGTTIGTATGAALAFKQQRSDRVCVCSFGDGTANRGDFHENINLAAIWRLPIVYVCQNNGWAISQPASSYLPAPVAARAAAYGIAGRTVDGQDVEAVRAVVAQAIERARSGDGPTLVDALTYRGRGHWAGHILADVDRASVVERPDPIDVLRVRLLERGLATEPEIDQIKGRAVSAIAAAVEQARAAADVTDAELGVDDVFA